MSEASTHAPLRQEVISQTTKKHKPGEIERASPQPSLSKQDIPTPVPDPSPQRQELSQQEERAIWAEIAQITKGCTFTPGAPPDVFELLFF